jgi:hypothetical protein
MDQELRILVVLSPFVLGFLASLWYIKFNRDKSAVTRAIRRRGGTVEYIRARTPWIGKEREWDVTYRDEQGDQHSVTCCVQRGWGQTVYWKDENADVDS